MGGMKRQIHHRNNHTFRSSVFEEVRPEDVALHRGGKKMGIQPKVDTFDHLFGSSISSRNAVKTRRILGPSHQSFLTGLQSGKRRCSLRPSMFSMDVNRNSFQDNATSVLHRPLGLNRTFENQRPSNSSAKDCLSSANKFPPLERVIKASGGRSSADLVPSGGRTETREDFPGDIFWLGDPPADLSKSYDAEPRIEEMSYAPPEQSPYDSEGAIYWLGDPALEEPRQKSTKCRSRLRPNQINMLQTRVAASCRIRQGRNSFL